MHDVEAIHEKIWGRNDVWLSVDPEIAHWIDTRAALFNRTPEEECAYILKVFYGLREPDHFDDDLIERIQGLRAQGELPSQHQIPPKAALPPCEDPTLTVGRALCMYIRDRIQ